MDPAFLCKVYIVVGEFAYQPKIFDVFLTAIFSWVSHKLKTIEVDLQTRPFFVRGRNQLLKSCEDDRRVCNELHVGDQFWGGGEIASRKKLTKRLSAEGVFSGLTNRMSLALPWAGSTPFTFPTSDGLGLRTGSLDTKGCVDYETRTAPAKTVMELSLGDTDSKRLCPDFTNSSLCPL